MARMIVSAECMSSLRRSELIRFSHVDGVGDHYTTILVTNEVGRKILSDRVEKGQEGVMLVLHFRINSRKGGWELVSFRYDDVKGVVYEDPPTQFEEALSNTIIATLGKEEAA